MVNTTLCIRVSSTSFLSMYCSQRYYPGFIGPLLVRCSAVYSTSPIRLHCRCFCTHNNISDGVAWIWCEEGHEIKRKYFLRAISKNLMKFMQKQWQNYRPVYFYWIGNHMESNVRSLCRSEGTWKIKQLEVEGGHVPQCPIAGDANEQHQ